MADLAVGLAKSVVEGTLSKAQAAIEQEGKLRRSAQRDLVFITGEFQMMQSFLKVANSERVENPVVMTWVRQIRDLAYDVEDCIEFVVHLDGNRGWWWRMVPSWTSWCGAAVAMPLDEAVDEIEQLKARVEEVSTRNTRYSLISDTGSKPASVEEQQPGASARAAAALSMLMGAGRRQQGDLTQLLTMKIEHDDGGDRIPRVISMWGTSADLGATSIIWKAYNDPQICKSFTRRAWVKLTHPFNPHDFIGCLKDQFHANAIQELEGKENIGLDALRRRVTADVTQDDHLKEVEKQLDEERYLVVLEGLSTLTDWDAIRKFFPARKSRSCIIVSTQQSEVASLSVGHPHQILDLNQYSADHSVYAFYKEGSQFLGDKGEVTTDTALSSTLKKKAAEDWIAKNPLVARDTDINELSEKFIHARRNSIPVISVWGIASVGKSALVKRVFCNRILSDCSKLEQNGRGRLFDMYGWVDIPHPFNLTDFARSLLLSFASESVEAKKIAERGVSSNNPIVECQIILKSKRCLVVIDDLQSTKEWDLIQTRLVSGFARNCIVTITNEASLARQCRGDKGDILFNVKSLGSDPSYQLFKNKALSTNGGLQSSWFDANAADLQELVSKCGGLPEVIVEIARLFGNKSVKRMEYANFLSNHFVKVLETNREFDCLQGLFDWIRTYFRTCPDSLKPCIFYLSIFPRGCSIRRRRLVRRWIAEGYSRDNHEESAELIGEKQFSDLLELSMFQRPPIALGDMRRVSCQVSGFIREYILSRRMEENLVFELGGANCTITTQRSGRHLVILENWQRDRIMFDSIDFSRLRSLTVFGNWESFFISQSMKLLRVLDLENASHINYEDLENMVKWTCRLKFLSLRGHHEIHRLPRSMHHLRQLQTLDVRETSIVTLPESITKLEKLQYIRVGNTNTPASATPVSSCSCFCRRGDLIGAEVPIGVGRLTALHTLGVVNIAVSGKMSMVKEVKKLTQLRKLGVSGINKHSCVKFFEAIKVLVHLESLSVQLDKGTELQSNVIHLPLESPSPWENLRSLKLYGLNDQLPEFISKLSKLEKLDFEMVTSIDENLMSVANLQQLCILRVKQQQGGQLNFSIIHNREESESYQELKVLEVTCSFSTLSVTFGSKTMKKLELLKIDCCNGPPPYQFSGLGNLTGLKEVSIVNCSNAETLKKQFEEDLKLVKPAVNVKLVDASSSS